MTGGSEGIRNSWCVLRMSERPAQEVLAWRSPRCLLVCALSAAGVSADKTQALNAGRDLQRGCVSALCRCECMRGSEWAHAWHNTRAHARTRTHVRRGLPSCLLLCTQAPSPHRLKQWHDKGRLLLQKKLKDSNLGVAFWRHHCPSDAPCLADLS